ncbi:MAG: MBL fold metallo-hydrolase [Deltaproteobacteria bacterium]|nr:MBL fold metallo-hydrolase [Deltaproteobacteria bacterium]
MTNLKTLLAASLFATLASTAHADPKPLEVSVYTASPTGFLVDSTIISGEHDAILIDGQFDLADAHRLVAQLLESKKNLTTVYITHYHPDHYFGLTVIKQAFPKAKLVALPAALAEIKKTAKPKVAQWSPMYGALIPSDPVLPTALAKPELTLEGQTLEIHGGVTGDDVDNSYVWIPSIKTVVAGDIVFRGVHPWTANTKPEQRKAWIKTLDDIAALHPTTVIAGHKDPKLDNSPAGIKQTRDYLEAFDAAVASSHSSAEVQQKLKAKYPDLQLDVILQLGADAAYAK